jgi:hypothetical protein
MNPKVSDDIRDLIETVHFRPSVSVIMPFDPKMGLQTEISYSLKIAADKVQKELGENYPGEMSDLVAQKLRSLIKNLNFNTHKKSIAIYVSPLFEKVLYLDIPVEEKIIIDDSFEIRDLVYSKKQLHKYLVLVLGGRDCRIYLGNTNTFVRIVSNTPESIEAYVNDVPERVANFSDVSARKEIMMDKFLLHIDNSLDLILNAYQLPLFVMGNDRLLGHFRSITKHARKISEFIHGNYGESSPEKLKATLAPHIQNWQQVIQKDLLNQIEEAAGKKKLAVGMKEVWTAALQRKGRLLVVEKDFMYAAQHGSRQDIIYPLAEPYNRFSYIKDAVDDVIEKVLENGGDVEFVDPGLLNEFNRIALIKYY